MPGAAGGAAVGAALGTGGAESGTGGAERSKGTGGGPRGAGAARGGGASARGGREPEGGGAGAGRAVPTGAIEGTGGPGRALGPLSTGMPAAVGRGVRADGRRPGGTTSPERGTGGPLSAPRGKLETGAARGAGPPAGAGGRCPGAGRGGAARGPPGVSLTEAPHCAHTAVRGGLWPSQFGQTTARADSRSCDMGGETLWVPKTSGQRMRALLQESRRARPPHGEPTTLPRLPLKVTIASASK